MIRKYGAWIKIQTKSIETKVLSLDLIIVDATLAAKSMFQVGTTCYHVVRLRLINGQPVMIDDSFFKSDVVPRLTRRLQDNQFTDTFRLSQIIKLLAHV